MIQLQISWENAQGSVEKCQLRATNQDFLNLLLKEFQFTFTEIYFVNHKLACLNGVFC